MLALVLLPLLAQASLGASIGHDQVEGFPETVPVLSGEIYKAYQPHLKVVNGCVPFPAVDAEGNTSGGLQTTGTSNGDCNSSTGQIYVRGHVNITSNEHALMYSWYMPKDNPSQDLGHRHDWEGVIVWLSSPITTAADNILAVCPSAHGGWDCSTDKYTLQESSPLIKYFSVWPVNHQCGLTDAVGGKQPLVAWESLPSVSREALETADFGSGHVPFKDANFEGNLEIATF